MKHRILLLTVICTLLLVSAAPAFSADDKTGPGPVVLTLMERVESQSGALSPGTTAPSGETFLYTMVSAFRKLDNDVTGNVYFLNKYSIDDETKASDVYGLSLTRTLTNKWKGDLSFSHSTNPSRNTVRSSDSDRFSFGLTYKMNPNEKASERYTFKTTYSTGTDFSQGRTLSQSISAEDNFTKKWTYNVGYTFVWGLNEDAARGLFREHYTNQWAADFSFKIDKKQRVTLGYLYLDQLFNAARTLGDNSLSRVSYFYSYY